MAHSERIPLGRRPLISNAANVVLCAALGWSLALFSCAETVEQPATEPSEDDESEANDDEDDQELDTLAVAEFVHEAADKSCTTFSRCLGAGADAALSGQTCAERRGFVLEDTFADLEPLIDEGRVTYDEDAALDCLQKIAALDCDELPNAAELPCLDAIGGTVAIGDACDRDLECEGNTFCALAAACPGTCTARHGQGEDCEKEAECDAALACVGGRCLAPAAAQAACGPDSPCNATALCVGANVAQGIDGTCIALADAFAANEGDSCSFTTASYCAPGLSCVVAAIGHTGGAVSNCEKPAGRDGACNFGFPTPCPESQYCDAEPASGGTEGTCRDLPGEGETCVAISGAPPCGAGLGCVERVCTPIGRIGAACASDAECRSQHCAGGECSAGLGC